MRAALTTTSAGCSAVIASGQEGDCAGQEAVVTGVEHRLVTKRGAELRAGSVLVAVIPSETYRQKRRSATRLPD